MKRITVFCGSSPGYSEVFHREATALGRFLGENGIGIVYGGARIGLMGAVADGALSTGGEVIGVLPRFLQTVEIAHTELTELILVDSMHERKAQMEKLSDGMIALPGGFGTLEELFEILTWGQLGLHQKPVALLNVEGFYDELVGMLSTMVEKGFLKELNREMLIVRSDVRELLDAMRNHQAPAVPKWISPSRT